MDNLEQSIIKSLDGKDKVLLPYIPYLLQDLWEIGSSAEIIIRLLRKHNCVNIKSKILDLGCGKGFISVNLAKEFECQVHGIDAMPEFIDEAKYWADKYHLSHLCNFEIGDIRHRAKELTNYDVIILGSIGPVLGNIKKTLKTVKNCITKNGYIVLDDGYIPEGSIFENENYLKQSEVEKQFFESGIQIVDPYIIAEDFITESDADIYSKIEIRANELIEKHPDKKGVFVEYLRIQREENDILENKVECVTWLLKKSD